MINVHKVRVRMFWRFLSGLSTCDTVVTAGSGTVCGAGITVISDCCKGGIGWVVERSSAGFRSLGSGTEGAVTGPGFGSGSRSDSGAGGS